MLKAAFTEPDARPTVEGWHAPDADGRPLADTYAWEERRLAAMREGHAGPIHYGWVPQDSLSVSRSEARRVGLDALDFDAEPVAVRATGGTVVPQGPGTMNLTLFTRHRRHPGIRPFYEAWCAALRDGFAAVGLETTVGPCEGSFCDGDYNVLVEGRKLAGTAQRWSTARDGSALGHHHAVIMLGGDPETLCARVDALYRAAGLPDRAEPTVHSTVALHPDRLRDALRGPMNRLLEREIL